MLKHTLLVAWISGIATVAAADPEPVNVSRTALVVIDPQNDFLRSDGIAYGLLSKNIAELGTIPNIETLLKTAKSRAMTVAISPHFYFAQDDGWLHPGAILKKLGELHVFHRGSALDSKGFEGSGSDFLARYKPYIFDGKTIVASPHKVFGPESNDLLLQLRSRDIDTVILAGMVANLCTDSHMRALEEAGFKVYVVKDAVAAPSADAYKAAVVNYEMVANGVWTTRDAVAAMTKK